jgi:hypothetical protein
VGQIHNPIYLEKHQGENKQNKKTGAPMIFTRCRIEPWSSCFHDDLDTLSMRQMRLLGERLIQRCTGTTVAWMCNWEWQQRTSSHQRWKKDEPSQWHGIRNCEQSPAESSSSNNGNNPTGKLRRLIQILQPTACLPRESLPTIPCSRLLVP